MWPCKAQKGDKNERYDFRLGEVIFPYGYNFDSRTEKLFLIDGEREIHSYENVQFGEKLTGIEKDFGLDIFAMLPIKLDPFGESRIHLVLRDKRPYAVANNGDLVLPENLEKVNQELAEKAAMDEED